MPKQTVWIVDGGYLYKASPVRVDYLKLKAQLEQRNGGSFFESYYLNSASNASESQDAFHNWLKCAPPHGPKMRVQLYGLKDKKLTCPECQHGFSVPVQKGVDVGIATLILKLATQNQYERLVLSSGDGDFEDAISYVKSELHKDVWIAGFAHTVSADLQSYANHVIWLNDFADSFRKFDGVRSENLVP